MLGLCALFKLPLMLFGALFLLRGALAHRGRRRDDDRRHVLLSLAVFGLEINIDWYRNCVEPFLAA